MTAKYPKRLRRKTVRKTVRLGQTNFIMRPNPWSRNISTAVTSEKGMVDPDEPEMLTASS
jgi:hypothetical protein